MCRCLRQSKDQPELESEEFVGGSASKRGCQRSARRHDATHRKAELLALGSCKFAVVCVC